MKSLILLLLLAIFVCTTAPGQQVSKNSLYIDDLPFNEEGQLVFQEVVPAEYSQDKLYLLSKVFFTKVFKSADAVVQFDDRETATIIGNGFSEISVETGFSPLLTRMFYTITIQCKDKRYRYEIGGIYFRNYPTAEYPSTDLPSSQMFSKANYYKKNGSPRPLMESYRDQTVKAINDLVRQLVDTMNFTKPIDDW